MKQKINPSVTHPHFSELERKYELTEDAFCGDVREYVPKLSGQTEKEFNDYVSRAAYFGVVERTTQAIIGAMTRKPFKLTGRSEFPDTEYHTSDAFLQTVIRDLLLGARVGILVDVNEFGASKLINYDADDIINWSKDFIIIKEETLVPSEINPYEHVCEASWRELYYDEQGYYATRRWTKNNKGDYQAEDLPQLLVNGAPIKEIPLYISTPYDNTWDVYTPPLYVQAGLNIQHFKQSVDIAHYSHFIALPTFTIAGNLATYDDGEGNQRNAEVCIGSTSSPLHITEASKASITEISGSSGAFLQEQIDKIEERMFISGSRLLSSKKGVESVEALTLRSGSESAVLETITNALESALNGALRICDQIDRVPASEIELNSDFTSSVIDPQMIAQLLALYTNNAITIEQLTNELLNGEVISLVELPEPVINNTTPSNEE